VLVSKDGNKWESVSEPPRAETPEPVGNVLLNREARFVRLETTRVNDGTGWALGLREIWVTEGHDDSEIARQFRPHCVSQAGAVSLAWTVPEGVRAAGVRLYASDSPTAPTEKPLATLEPGVTTYRERIPNWTPRYYRVEAVDAAGKALLRSEPVAAVARSASTVAPPETFAFWYEPYKPSTESDASIKHIGDAAFVVGPGFEAAADLAKLGKGLLPYVTFYQTAGWAPIFSVDADPKQVADAIAPVAFYRKSARFQGCPAGYVPSVFCRPGNVEFNGKSIQFTLCPNSTRLRELVLAHVRKQLAGGALGFFVDNGYDDDVAARSVCQSSAHVHYYGEDLTGADAFLGLMLDVICEVKKRHPNGVVMLNGGVPPTASFYGLSQGDVCDGTLWESYLRSSYSTPKEHVYDWQPIHEASMALEKAARGPVPQRKFVLSYPWDRDEAFFCYATAKLCDLPWSASLGISDPHHLRFGGHFGTYPELIDLRLGRPLEPEKYGGAKFGEVFAREYERGIVLVNPTKTTQTAAVPRGKARRYRDVFTGSEGEGDTLSLEMRAESGRVFLWR
jgi:hypothetical protein